MTSQPADHSLHIDSIKLSSAAQVAASVPYMLGFWPRCSVVGLFFNEQDQMVLTARVDFPVNAESTVIADAFASCCVRAASQGASQVQVVAFPDPQMRLPDRVDALIVLDGVAETSALDVLAIGSVLDGQWVPLGADGTGCAPFDDSADELAVACQWISRGATYAADRTTLADVVVGETTELAAEATAVMQDGGVEFARDFLRTRANRQEVEDLIFDYVTHSQSMQSPDVRLSSGPLTAELIVLWAVALKDRRVREPLLWRVAVGNSGTGEEAREVAAAFCTITRNTPPEIAAAVASCTAATAWQSGNGALARIAAEHGLNCEPRNVLSGLVLNAVSSGVHPGVWVEMLRSMPLAELRATVMKGRK